MKRNQHDRIVVIGGVGTALNIIEQITDARENHGVNIKVEGVVIDSCVKGTSIGGVPVIGGLNDLEAIMADERLGFIFALFKPEKMKERYLLFQELPVPEARLASFVHPGAFIARSVETGRGNVILSNSTINSNVRIGNLNIINSNVVVEHDSFIGNGNFLAAGSCTGAGVLIGDHCFVGLNSSLREGIKLKENVFVGMHSLVLHDFSDCRIAGNPAKVIGH